MSEMGKFLAFQAAVALCQDTGRKELLREVYEACAAQAGRPAAEMENHVRRLYDAFGDARIAEKAAELVYPVRSGWKGELRLIFQTIPDLHRSCPGSSGDWYFTGDYPTPGGLAVLNRAYMNFWEKREGRAY